MKVYVCEEWDGDIWEGTWNVERVFSSVDEAFEWQQKDKKNRKYTEFEVDGKGEVK